jgi:hypothetical protein
MVTALSTAARTLWGARVILRRGSVSASGNKRTSVLAWPDANALYSTSVTCAVLGRPAYVCTRLADLLG